MRNEKNDVFMTQMSFFGKIMTASGFMTQGISSRDFTENDVLSHK